MQPVVVDASALASSLLPHEDGTAFRALLDTQPRLTAARLLQAEIANLLLMQERRGRISSDHGREAFTTIADLGIALATDAGMAAVSALAWRHGLTA